MSGIGGNVDPVARTTAGNALAGSFYGTGANDVTGARSKGVAYTNTTGRALFLHIDGLAAAVGGYIVVTVGATSNFSSQGFTLNGIFEVQALIPNGASYTVTDGTFVNSISRWVETKL